MAHDVFISYSSKDKPVADAVCATLESHGVRCWIAPRDVLAGEEYAASLLRGLSDSRLMVLVFSAGSNHSPQVLREVERAVSKGLPILPMKIQDVPMSAAMEYYISSRHWLDALTPPLERHLGRLCESVKSLLSRSPDDSHNLTRRPSQEGMAASSTTGTPVAEPEHGSTQPPAPTPMHPRETDAVREQTAGRREDAAQKRSTLERPTSRRRRLWLGVGAVLAAFAGFFYFVGVKGRSTTPPPVQNASSSVNEAPAVFQSINNRLLSAASSGDTAVAARLLKQGADIEAADNQGNTALLLAAKSRKVNTAEMLLAKGANMEAKDHQGYTALIAACTGGYLDMAQMLVNKGASIDARDGAGATPLMHAGLSGNTAIVSLLLAKGADINAEDDNGETPLMYAASAGSVAAAKLMISKKANPAIKDHNGQTALGYAERWKRPEVVQLLGHGGR